MHLVRPELQHLPSYLAAFEEGWSADSARSEAAREEIACLRTDGAAFVASMEDRGFILGQARPAAVPLIKGSLAARGEYRVKTNRRSTHMSSQGLRELTQRFSGEGRVDFILLRPARLAAVKSVSEVVAEPGRGLVGDRRSLALGTGESAQKREVTLLQAEHLPVIAAWLGLPSVTPDRLRRNLVVSGINLLSMRSPFRDVHLEWCFGEEVSLEVTGSCEPCSRMESELGEGGYNAMRGHGGVTARVLVGGTIRVGDRVRVRIRG